MQLAPAFAGFYRENHEEMKTFSSFHVHAMAVKSHILLQTNKLSKKTRERRCLTLLKSEGRTTIAWKERVLNLCYACYI